ncbi:MAG: hypothetical protein K1Y01_20340 [Vicinamibacteria bacterium]|nr:hypothetical protein [Vicinamibacteria bacterium]
MNETTLGRLTLIGGPQVEKTLRELVVKATRAICGLVPKENLKALVLAGGYGRGEGGIRVGEDGERPANNLDLLLFTVGLRASARAQLTAKVNHALDTLRRRSGMGFDFSAVDARRVERDRVRVLWYDVRHGHKLLAGDPEFLPGLKRFTAENIDRTEMADLVINRGALLVLNDIILANGPLTPVRREAVLTHTAKAVIGYGDAFLFTRGAYHWSYAERRHTMADMKIPASQEFKALYETAMRYRFSGESRAADRLVAEAESGNLTRVLAAVHLEVERRRLRARHMTFDGYVARSLRHELDDFKSSLRKLAKGALVLVRGGLGVGGGAISLRMALQAGGEQGVVRALFPLMLYGQGGAEDLAAARSLLDVKKPKSTAGKMAWLRLWGRVFDPNLVFTFKRLGLPVEVAA